MKFQENIYQNENELPAFNFYQSNIDISYMMKDRTFIPNEGERLVLLEKYVQIIDWVAENLNPSELQRQMRWEKKHFQYVYKVELLKLIYNVVNTFRREGEIKDFLNEREMLILKDICNQLNVEYVEDVVVLLAKFELRTIGLNTEFKRLKPLRKSENVKRESNYLAEALAVQRYLKIQFDPMKITIAFWVEHLKAVREQQRHEENKLK